MPNHCGKRYTEISVGTPKQEQLVSAICASVTRDHQNPRYRAAQSFWDA